MPKRDREGVSVTGTLSLSPSDVGKTLFATGGATITLPNPAQCEIGDDILIINTSDDTLTVSYNEKIITLNNVAADAVALSTSSEKAGGGFWCHCTGSKWACLPLTEETQTVTVTTD
jgi:hypothetical protein